MKTELIQAGNNAYSLHLAGIVLFFSYAMCIGYTREDGEQLVNPDAIGASASTTRHLRGFGLKVAKGGAEVAESPAAFEDSLLMELRTL